MGLRNVLKKFAVSNGRTTRYQPVSDGSSESRTENYSYYEKEYQCGLIFNAIGRITDEIIKMSPQHIIKSQGNSEYLFDTIQQVLDKPNETMTQTDFLNFITFQLMVSNNAYILKKFNDKGEVCGLYPVAPNSAEKIKKDGRYFYLMKFNDSTIPDSCIPDFMIIHVKNRVTKQSTVGGTGMMKNGYALYFANAHRDLSENLRKATQLMPSMMISFTSLADEEDYNRIKADVLRAAKTDGLIFEDPRFDVKDGVNFKANRQVDIETLRYFEQAVCTHYGMNTDILNGTATPEQHEQFINNTIKPIVKILSEAFSASFFTDLQFRKGHRIQFMDNDLSLMSIDQKIAWLNIVRDIGIVSKNQMLNVFGMPGLPNGGEVILQSLNYVDISIANEYQLGHKEKEIKEQEEAKELLKDKGAEPNE